MTPLHWLLVVCIVAGVFFFAILAGADDNDETDMPEGRYFQ